MDENDEEYPGVYERRVIKPDEFLRWCGRITVFALIVLNVILIGFWRQLDKIYEGNPQSGSRELLCAIAKDDAQADPEVRLIYDKVCAKFDHDLTVP